MSGCSLPRPLCRTDSGRHVDHDMLIVGRLPDDRPAARELDAFRPDDAIGGVAQRFEEGLDVRHRRLFSHRGPVQIHWILAPRGLAGRFPRAAPRAMETP